MKKERVLITGAAGFVGGYLVRHLYESHPDWEVLRAGALSDLGCDANFAIEDADAAEKIVLSFKPTKIVHLAAVTTVRATETNPRAAWDINLNGTLNLVLPFQKVTPGGHFLLISSAEVYGLTHEDHAFSEACPVVPLNTYSASKGSAELLVRAAATAGLVTTIARPFTHIGPGQSTRFAFPYFASQITAIERGEVPAVLKVGSMEDLRDITDVRDVVDAYVRILERGNSLENGDIFNIATGISHRMGDLLAYMLSLSTSSITVQVDPSRVRPMTRVRGNADKAVHLLDWKPRRKIEETLKDILDHCRSLP